MVALDDRDRAARPQQVPEGDEGVDRLGEVLEDEADKDVVERPGLEGQVEEVPLANLDVLEPGRLDPVFRLGDRVGRHLDRHEPGARAPRRECDCLGADAAARFQDDVAVGVGGVVVQQLDERSRLVAQPFSLAGVVTVNVGVSHRGHDAVAPVFWQPKVGCQERLRVTASGAAVWAAASVSMPGTPAVRFGSSLWGGRGPRSERRQRSASGPA